MHPYLALTFATLYSILYYILIWPLLQLYHALLAILTPVSNALRFLLLPVTTLVHSIASALLYPFGFIPSFETLYIYLGIASLIGIAAGVILAVFYTLFVRIFSLDVSNENDSQPVAVRSAKEYREARQQKKLAAVDPLLAYGGMVGKGKGKGRAGGSGRSGSSTLIEEAVPMFGQTILEEEDSEELEW